VWPRKTWKLSREISRNINPKILTHALKKKPDEPKLTKVRIVIEKGGNAGTEAARKRKKESEYLLERASSRYCQKK